MPHSSYQAPGEKREIERLLKHVLELASAIKDPFEQAFFLLVHVPYLSPFAIGNRTVARLAANIPLMQRRLMPLTFEGVEPSAYAEAMQAIWECNELRLLKDVFLSTYERTAQRLQSGQDTMITNRAFRVAKRRELSAMVCDAVRLLINEANVVEYVSQCFRGRLEELESMEMMRDFYPMLSDLHEGNLARHGISKPEYEAWRAVWHAKSDR